MVRLRKMHSENAVEQVVARAIELSVHTDKIVYLDASDIDAAITSPDGNDATCEDFIYELASVSDGSADGMGCTEYWGEDNEGNNWRVHLV